MTYSDIEFGHDLLAQLAQGYEPLRIAKWAYTVFLDADRRDRSRRVQDALIDLFTMEEGPEFHIPEDALHALANSFVATP